MTVELKCYANCDDVFLVWWSKSGGSIAPIDGCLGFQIEVRYNGQTEVLPNLKGFQSNNPSIGESEPSNKWPFQTYSWTHHASLHGGNYQNLSYRVTAMKGQPSNLQPDPNNTSAWVDVRLSADAGDGIAAYFNRGFILSQFVSRYARENHLNTMAALKRDLTSEVGGKLMQFLCGELGQAIRGIVTRVQNQENLDLYCSLFELDLDDLIDDLVACGGRAHVVLANGSTKEVGGDENTKAAEKLQGKVDLHRRMTAPHGLAHNKFVVVCQDGAPEYVWTGSTNWSLTGLHTQVNNGIALKCPALAQMYLDHWHALVEAGDAFPPALVANDKEPRGPIPIGSTTGRVWFTPTPHASASHDGGPDIDDLKRVVADAKQGILFVMFMPGQEPLDSILMRQRDGIYVRGVVSTLPMGTKDKPSATFQLMTGEDFKAYDLDVVQPYGADAIGSFVSTFTRQQFLGGMGYAITHSKIIVVDPFGDHPVVVTGSHNFSASASGKNDENLLIIENCRELAVAYAVNCMSIYQHYRWPAYLHEQKLPKAKPGAGYLDTSPSWQAQALSGQKVSDLKFWGAA